MDGNRVIAAGRQTIVDYVFDGSRPGEGALSGRSLRGGVLIADPGERPYVEFRRGPDNPGLDLDLRVLLDGKPDFLAFVGEDRVEAARRYSLYWSEGEAELVLRGPTYPFRGRLAAAGWRWCPQVAEWSLAPGGVFRRDLAEDLAAAGCSWDSVPGTSKGVAR